MTALETLKNVIKAAEEGNDLDEKAGLQAISDIKVRKKLAEIN